MFNFALLINLLSLFLNVVHIGLNQKGPTKIISSIYRCIIGTKCKMTKLKHHLHQTIRERIIPKLIP